MPLYRALALDVIGIDAASGAVIHGRTGGGGLAQDPTDFSYTVGTRVLAVGAANGGAVVVGDLAAGDTTSYMQWNAGSTAAVSGAGSGRIRYNQAANQLEFSNNGGAYAALGGGGGGVTLDGAYDFGGAGAGRAITVDSGAVVLTGDAADNNNVLEISKSPVGAQSGDALSIAMSATATGLGINADPDADRAFVFGRARFASPSSDFAHFSHFDQTGAANYAIRQSASGITTVSGTTQVIFSRNNVAQFNMTIASGFYAQNASGPAMLNEATTVTNPVFCPDRTGLTTGIGGTSAVVSLIVGGTEEARGETSGLRVFGTVGMFSNNAAGPAVLNETTTVTNPTLIPDRADLTTGIGGDAAVVSIIINSVEAVHAGGGAATTSYLEYAAGSTAALSPANKGRIIYNEATVQFEASVNGGAYAALGGAGGVTLDGAYDFGGAGAGRTITVDSSLPVELLRDAVANARTYAVTALHAHNSTAAALGAQQYSPMIIFEGQVWETTGGSSQEIQFALQAQPVQAANAIGDLVIASNRNGGGFKQVAAIGHENGPTNPQVEVGANDAAYTGQAFLRLKTSVRQAYIALDNASAKMTIQPNTLATGLQFGAGGSPILNLSDSYHTILQYAKTTGLPLGFTYTGGAHTNLNDVLNNGMLFDLSATINFVDVTTDQSAVRILAPTYTSDDGAGDTIAVASTLYLDAAPTGAANVTITDPRVINAAPDIDSTFVFGRTKLGALVSDYFVVAHFDNYTASSFCILQSSVGSTVVNSANGQTLDFAINGTAHFLVDATNGIYAANAAGPTALNEASSATNPTLVPNRTVLTTGIGGTSSGISLIALGVEIINVDSTGGVTITQAASAGTTPNEELTVRSANHGTITTTAEAPSVNFDFSATKQWATGAITRQREFKILAPTYAFVGASVITAAITMDVVGAPSVGPNATINASVAFNAKATATLASVAGLNSAAVSIEDYTVTLTGNTQLTGNPSIQGLSIGAITISDAVAITVDFAAAAYINSAPVGGGAGPAAITNSYALWVDNDVCRFDDGILMIEQAAAPVTVAATQGLIWAKNDNPSGIYWTNDDDNAIRLDRMPRKAVTTTPYTHLITDQYIGVNRAGVVTVNLVAVATVKEGYTVVIADESGNASTNNITIDANGGELIDGATTFVINQDYNSVTLYCTGSVWKVI